MVAGCALWMRHGGVSEQQVGNGARLGHDEIIDRDGMWDLGLVVSPVEPGSWSFVAEAVLWPRPLSRHRTSSALGLGSGRVGDAITCRIPCCSLSTTRDDLRRGPPAPCGCSFCVAWMNPTINRDR